MALLYTPPKGISFNVGLYGVPTTVSRPRFAGVPTTISRPLFMGLGVAPAVALPIIGITTAISALAAIVQNRLDDDWTDPKVFQTNMQQIHSAMLALQCTLGGAQLGSPLVDTLGNTVCDGGTKPLCNVSSGLLTQWRTLRDSFSKFWADNQNYMLAISSAVASQAKQYAKDFYAFYGVVQKTCAAQGVRLENLASQPGSAAPSDTPGWIKYASWGAGAFAVIAVAVAAKSIWGKSHG
jgi:hypothetical protein